MFIARCVGQDSLADSVACSGFPPIQDNHDEAGRLYKRAIEATEASLGAEDPELAIRLRDLAQLLVKQVRKGALASRGQIIACWRRALGRNGR